MGLVSNLSITEKLILITMGASTLTLLLSTLNAASLQACMYLETLAERIVTVNKPQELSEAWLPRSLARSA